MILSAFGLPRFAPTLRSRWPGGGHFSERCLMASISTDENGNVRILFVGAVKKRRAVHLGRVNKKHAGSIKLKVEALVASIATRTPIDSENAQWVGAICDDLPAKLGSVGLVAPRESRKLRAFLDIYVAGHENDRSAKPATLTTICSDGRGGT